MQQRLKWLFIAFIWILHEQETFLNGLPANGTFSSSISTNNTTDSLNSTQNIQKNHSESSNNKTSLLDSFLINTWHQSKNEEGPSYVNLVLLPVAALVCFLVMISLRCCTWQREDQKFKDRGCSYDVTNFIILTQSDADYSDVDMRSDNLSNYDTVNSYVSGVPKSPWRAHSAMPSYVSLQSRIDSQMYDTVTSYRSYLQSPQGRKTFNFDKKDIAENDKLVNGRQTPQRPRKIPGTRFSIVPALDNYMRLKNLNKSPSQPDSPRLLRTASESPDTLSSNGSETGAIPRRNKKSRVSFTEKNKHCGPSRRPRTCKMVDAETQVDVEFRRKRRASSQKLSYSRSSSNETVDSNKNKLYKSTEQSQGYLNEEGPRVHKNKLVKVDAEVYKNPSPQPKQYRPNNESSPEEKENLPIRRLIGKVDRDSGLSEVSEETMVDFGTETDFDSPLVENECPGIQINIITNPCTNDAIPEEQSPPPVSSLLCCPSIPPKTKSETDLFKNNNNNNSTENLCRRKSCDLIQKSLGKNAKISPIGVHQTKCFCDNNNRKFSLGAISNEPSSIFKSKNIGNSLSSLKDVLNLRKKNCGQDSN